MAAGSSGTRQETKSEIKHSATQRQNKTRKRAERIKKPLTNEIKKVQ
ncbi:MAG: hypothetical protein [Microvirus sp.]|nr:MAG: hypothetical protein [Microvirus sp.]